MRLPSLGNSDRRIHIAICLTKSTIHRRHFSTDFCFGFRFNVCVCVCGTMAQWCCRCLHSFCIYYTHVSYNIYEYAACILKCCIYNIHVYVGPGSIGARNKTICGTTELTVCVRILYTFIGILACL